jgi:6-pyruvoyl-tetrahydropterin synthase
MTKCAGGGGVQKKRTLDCWRNLKTRPISDVSKCKSSCTASHLLMVGRLFNYSVSSAELICRWMIQNIYLHLSGKDWVWNGLGLFRGTIQTASPCYCAFTGYDSSRNKAVPTAKAVTGHTTHEALRPTAQAKLSSNSTTCNIILIFTVLPVISWKLKH